MFHLPPVAGLRLFSSVVQRGRSHLHHQFRQCQPRIARDSVISDSIMTLTGTIFHTSTLGEKPTTISLIEREKKIRRVFVSDYDNRFGSTFSWSLNGLIYLTTDR